MAYDLLESIRLNSFVPSFGEARKAILETPSRIPQHPRYRGFWYDPERHSMVGMHLGVDLIRSGEKYYVLEMNLDAGIQPERREIFTSRFDPMILEIIQTAVIHEFKTVVLYRRHFRDAFIDEFKRAGRESGIEVKAFGSPHWGRKAMQRLAALPEVLSERTMYIVFSSRHTPMDFYMHDKLCGSIWFEENKSIVSQSKPEVNWVPTYEELIVPPFDPESRWPNLVVKLADWDKGLFVLMAKVRNKSEAIKALGLRHGQGMPGEFKLGWSEKLNNFFTRWGKVIYQPFIPPDFDREGHPRKIRMHLLVSPLANKFLSAHGVSYREKLWGQSSFGLLGETNRAVVRHSTGNIQRIGIEPEVEEEVRVVGGSIGRVVDQSLRQKFWVGP